MRKIILFVFLCFLISASFSGTYQTSISGSGSSTLEADKDNSCGGSNSNLFTTDISYSYDLLFTASSSSSLITPSTQLDFSVESGTEDVSVTISSNIPEIVYTSSLYSLVDYSSRNTFYSEYFSDSDFSDYEQDYSTCEIRTFTTDCEKIRGYFRTGNQITCTDGTTPAIDGNDIENYLISDPGVENPANYIEEKNGALTTKPNKKQTSYLICNGDVSFTSSSSHTIDLSNLQTITDTLPSSCFQPDANGFYSDTCDIPVDFSAKCYAVFADYYGSGVVYSYTMYSPVIMSSSSTLTISDLCHGYIDSSLSAPPVSMAAGSSTYYSFDVTNTGDLPIKITSPSSISLTNGFSFSPSSSITFPVEISPGETVVISGTLSSPNPMPSSFVLSVTSEIDKNAVDCNGDTTTTASTTVSVSEVVSCDILLEIINTPSLCKGMTNEVPLDLRNSGSGDVIVDNYTFSLSTGPYHYSECSFDCIILEGDETTHYISVDVPMTSESTSLVEIGYHDADDDSCVKIASKDLPVIDCGTITSFDLYPDDEEFINAYQGQLTHARFRVWNNITSSDSSPPSTVNYTISSGTNTYISPHLDFEVLDPGQSTGYFETEEIVCDGTITITIQVNPGSDGDFNPENNILTYTESCSPLSTYSGICRLKDEDGNYVEGSDIYMYPDSNELLDIECYDVDASGSTTLTLCEGTGSLTQNPSTIPPTITGHLVYNDPIYSSLSISSDTSPPLSDGDNTEFIVTIEKSLPGVIKTYSCEVTAYGLVPECLDYI